MKYTTYLNTKPATIADSETTTENAQWHHLNQWQIVIAATTGTKGLKMNEIEDLMHDGNWTDACSEFLALNMSPNDFRRELESGNYNLLDWSILGFYASKETE